MITFIKGKFVTKNPTYLIIETTGGVGYHINISLHTYTQLQGQKDGKVHTYFHVKEDTQTLYGFAETNERELFTYLISVSGIGPATAQLMLSSLNPQEIQEAIVSENVNVIKSMKGIGPKTAKRIILELKDKLTKLGTVVVKVSTTNNYREEALTALLALGIGKPLAQKALNRVTKSGKSIDSVEMLIKEALKVL